MVIQFPPDLQMQRQMERIRSSVDQYRNAPYRSADWLAGELMTIFDTEPANDVIAASPTLLEALEQLLKDVDELMGSSEGVAGLHHNGDLAPWSELAEGGQFSDWIGHATAKARAAITLATGKDA